MQRGLATPIALHEAFEKTECYGSPSRRFKFLYAWHRHFLNAHAALLQHGLAQLLRGLRLSDFISNYKPQKSRQQHA